jgi:hypothetical protein
MNTLGLLVALSLSAAPPFPAPKLITVTDATKADWGTIASVDPQKNTVVLTCANGPVTFQAGPSVQVVSADGKPAGGITSLRPGQNARVYYEVTNGAQASEIDLLQ